MSIRLLLVDDHAVVRSGLKMLLASEGDVEIVGEAGSGSEAVAGAGSARPNVILMDIGLPDMTGIEAARLIKSKFPERAAPEELVTAIRAAASGEVYLYPSLAKLLVKDFLSQEHATEHKPALNGLTEREQEVTELVMDAMGHDALGWLDAPPEALPEMERAVASQFNYLRAATIYGGSNEIQRNIIAKQILRLPTV